MVLQPSYVTPRYSRLVLNETTKTDSTLTYQDNHHIPILPPAHAHRDIHGSTQYITQLCIASYYISPLKSCSSMYTRIINTKHHIIQNTLFHKLSSVLITSSGPDVLAVLCGACSYVAPLRYSVRYGLFRLLRPGDLSSPRLRLSAQASPELGGG